MHRRFVESFLALLWCDIVYFSGSAYGQGCEFLGILYNNGGQLPDSCSHITCINEQWIDSGLNPSCGHGEVFNDPHFKTLDGKMYTFNGFGEYILMKLIDVLDSPFIFVNIFFKSFDGEICPPNASCVGITTFQDSATTTIKIGEYGLGNPWQLTVNGKLYTVHSTQPAPVVIGNTTHSVLAWRNGDCVQLVGSSKLSLQKCRDRVDIWAQPEYSGKLNGLCGLYNGKSDDDFTDKDGDQTDAYNFASSWQAPNCTLDADIEVQYMNHCDEHLRPHAGNMSTEDLDFYLESCLFDLCSFHHHTSGNQTVIQEWLGRLAENIKVKSSIVARTADYVPPILTKEETTTKEEIAILQDNGKGEDGIRIQLTVNSGPRRKK